MNKTQISAVKTVIDIVEEKLNQPLDLNVLSAEVGISKYHLHHLFKSITGLSLISYVRGRRLAASMKELIATDLHIIDIANEYQFKHEQSFTRAFSRRYGITPSQFRKEKCELPVESKIDINHLAEVGQGLLIQPRMCLRPEFYLMGIQDEIVHSENLKEANANKLALKFQKEYLQGIENAVDKNIYYGLVKYTYNSDNSNYYIPSIEIKAPVLYARPPYICNIIPTHEYAVFRYVGFHSPYEITYTTLLDLYKFVMNWLFQSSFQKTWYHFERMDLKNCSRTYCEMDIYIPVS